MRKTWLALALTLAFAMPAEAHIVYLKDGRTIEGTIQLEETRLVVNKPDGTAETFAYAQVQGVSLDNHPLTSTPPSTRPEWLEWAAVGVNVAAVVTAIWVASAARAATP